MKTEDPLSLAHFCRRKQIILTPLLPYQWYGRHALGGDADWREPVLLLSGNAESGVSSSFGVSQDPRIWGVRTSVTESGVSGCSLLCHTRTAAAGGCRHVSFLHFGMLDWTSLAWPALSQLCWCSPVRRRKRLEGVVGHRSIDSRFLIKACHVSPVSGLEQDIFFSEYAICSWRGLHPQSAQSRARPAQTGPASF